MLSVVMLSVVMLSVMEPFQPSLMFAGAVGGFQPSPGACPSKAPFGEANLGVGL
jgi:hypothetical protein